MTEHQHHPADLAISSLGEDDAEFGSIPLGPDDLDGVESCWTCSSCVGIGEIDAAFQTPDRGGFNLSSHRDVVDAANMM
jgi:hypothetical protein